MGLSPIRSMVPAAAALSMLLAVVYGVVDTPVWVGKVSLSLACAVLEPSYCFSLSKV